MAVFFQSGYSLPSGDEPLTHARILHANNWLSGGTVTASQTGEGYFAEAPANSLTYEFWSPGTQDTETWEYDHGSSAECDVCCIAAHNLGASGSVFRAQYEGVSRENLAVRSEEMGATDWVKQSVNASPAGITAPDGSMSASKVTADTSDTVHSIKTGFDAVEGNVYTFSVYAKAAGYPVVLLNLPNSAFGGGSDAFFDLETKISVNPLASIEALSDGWYRLSYPVEAVATLGTDFEVSIAPDLNSLSHGGDGVSGVYLWGAQIEVGSSATSYIRTEAIPVTSAWHDATGWIAPTDNSPVMALFEPVTAPAWRLEITGGTAAPEMGVARFGKALQMPRPSAASHKPLVYGRNTETRTNESETGEWLGRTVQRRNLQTSYGWSLIEDTWFEANWPETQRAMESEPFFLAWRPGDDQSVGYCWVDEAPAPSYTGQRNFMSVRMNVTARSWE